MNKTNENDKNDEHDESEKFNLYYENNNKQLIQQGILKRIQYKLGVAIVNIDIDSDISYIMIDDIPNSMKNLKELILNDQKNNISLYFLLCNNNSSQLFVHELV